MARNPKSEARQITIALSVRLLEPLCGNSPWDGWLVWMRIASEFISTCPATDIVFVFCAGMLYFEAVSPSYSQREDVDATFTLEVCLICET